jgi:hypothetical protein
MNKPVTRVVALLASAASLAVAVACGGHTSTDDLNGTADGGASSGSSGASSSGASSSGTSGSSGASSSGTSGSSGGSSCPATAPANGAACTVSALSCEYGSDPNILCNTLARCQQGRWVVQTPQPGSQCPSPGIQKGCPSSFGQASQGNTCAPPGLECDYPQGRCACSLGFGGPIQVDAGTGHWSCEAPPKGCPQPRPRVGSACTVPSNLSCNYGACVLLGGVTMQCQGGIWVETPTACPASAG